MHFLRKLLVLEQAFVRILKKKALGNADLDHSLIALVYTGMNYVVF